MRWGSRELVYYRLTLAVWIVVLIEGSEMPCATYRTDETHLRARFLTIELNRQSFLLITLVKPEPVVFLPAILTL